MKLVFEAFVDLSLRGVLLVIAELFISLSIFFLLSSLFEYASELLFIPVPIVRLSAVCLTEILSYEYAPLIFSF